MNLAKALCEIRYPQFHKMRESYSHGLRWRPSSDYLVDMSTEHIVIPQYRGIWHILWEVFTRKQFNNPKPVKLKILDLFACCPDISSEYERVSNKGSKLVCLIKPDFLNDPSESKIWTNFCQ